MTNDKPEQFINFFTFIKDNSRSGRVLEFAKVGKVYVSRLVIQPNQITGNYYHKKTNRLFMIEEGKVQMKFIQVNTGEVKEIVMTPGSGLVHVPSHVAFARKNIGKGPAVIIIFSDNPLRSDDDYEYEVYKN